MRRSRSIIAPVAVAIIALTACGSSDKKSSAKADAAAVTVRLGYFPNITHASAITGVEKGFFAQALGTNKLETSTFNAGPAAVEALFSEAIDAAYLGPNYPSQLHPAPW